MVAFKSGFYMICVPGTLRPISFESSEVWFMPTFKTSNEAHAFLRQTKLKPDEYQVTEVAIGKA